MSRCNGAERPLIVSTTQQTGEEFRVETFIEDFAEAFPCRPERVTGHGAGPVALFNPPSSSLRSGQIVKPEAEGVGETAQDGDGALLVAVLDGGQTGA